MDPFYVLQLPHEVTDDEVARRYQELVRQYPPDREPEVFQAIRSAYEAVRDETARLQTRLFYFDATGRALLLESKQPVLRQPLNRLRPEELAGLLVQAVVPGARDPAPAPAPVESAPAPPQRGPEPDHGVARRRKDRR